MGSYRQDDNDWGILWRARASGGCFWFHQAASYHYTSSGVTLGVGQRVGTNAAVGGALIMRARLRTCRTAAAWTEQLSVGRVWDVVRG